MIATTLRKGVNPKKDNPKKSSSCNAVWLYCSFDDNRKLKALCKIARNSNLQLFAKG
jgi:hypothetical protein